MIYLASQYSHPDPLVRKTRFLLAEQVTAILLRRGEIVFSPIVHCHELTMRHDLPGDFAFWSKYNLSMLRIASMLLVLKIPGWNESKGIAGEMAFARSAHIPLYTVDENGFYYYVEPATAEIGDQP